MKKFLCNILIIVLAISCFGCASTTTANEPKSTEKITTKPKPVPTTEPTYEYNINCDTKTVKSYGDGNTVEVSNATYKYDKKSNPTKLEVSFKVTKTHQASRLAFASSWKEYNIDNTIYITLYDVNGNQIGQKEIVTSLEEEGDYSNYSTFFQIEPGTYSIKFKGEDE